MISNGKFIQFVIDQDYFYDSKLTNHLYAELINLEIVYGNYVKFSFSVE